MTHVVAYFGGPRDGDVEEREGHVLDAPAELRFPVQRHPSARGFGEAVYALEPRFEPPGAIAYVFREP